MDTPALTRFDLAAMEAPGNSASEAARVGPIRAPRLEIGGERSRPLVERWGFAHESGPAEEMVL